MMHRPTRLKITDVNPHLICILCGGYLIDATTMIECLHSYCRACIVAYLRQSRQCPRCDTVVHKTRPLLNIRSDRTLQNLVYKLVPNLFKDEMKRRRDFYADHPQASTSMQSPNAREERGEVCEDSLVIYTEDEHISLSLDYYFAQPRKDKRQKRSGEGDTNPNGKRRNGDANGLPGDVVEKRYLRCPAAVCILHIKKFIRNKFGLSPAHRIEVVHQNGEDEPLRDDYTLMDIAYIYTWRRNGPLPLLFRVFEPYSKRRKGSQSSVSSSESVQSKVSSGSKPSSPAAQRQRSPSYSPGPLSSSDKDKHFQKPQVKWKAAPESAKTPSNPTKLPSSDMPGPSGKSLSREKNTPVPQKNNLGKPEKPTSSAANPIKKISSANTQVKNTVIVTSAIPVFTLSETAPSASLIIPKIGNKLSSANLPKPKTDASSSNGKALSLETEKSSTKTSMTSSKAEMKSPPTGMGSPKIVMTSSKEPRLAPKPQLTSPLPEMTKVSNSEKAKTTSTAAVTITTPSKAEMPPKPNTTLSQNDKVTPKPDTASPKPYMTPAKPDTTPLNPVTAPPKSDMSLKPDVIKPKPDLTSQKADAPPSSLTLSSTTLSPSQVKDNSCSDNGKTPEPAATDKTVTLQNAKVPPAAERSGKDEEKLVPPEPKGGDIAAEQNKEEPKIDQSASNTAVVKEDPKTEATPTEKTPPPGNNSASEEPMDVSVSDGVTIDTPVLLQT